MNFDKPKLNDTEFILIQELFFKECGIHLNDSKKAMVSTRLFKRLHHYQLDSYTDYLKIVNTNEDEKNEFLNALSTNETYFFREDIHFTFLTELAKKNTSLNVWSAATSMGSEAYSIAFILDYFLAPNKWQVMGSDINTEVLSIAAKGLYPFSWIENIPQPYRNKYCLKGHGRYENKMLVDPSLKKNMTFFKHNLIESIPKVEEFDVIFLRNVLLYFDEDIKIQVIKKLLPTLKVGGYFIISLTETFHENEIDELRFIANNIYQKV